MEKKETPYYKGRMKALGEVRARLEKEITALTSKPRPREEHALAYHKGLLSAYRRTLHVIKGKLSKRAKH